MVQSWLTLAPCLQALAAIMLFHIGIKLTQCTATLASGGCVSQWPQLRPESSQSKDLLRETRGKAEAWVSNRMWSGGKAKGRDSAEEWVAPPLASSCRGAGGRSPDQSAWAPMMRASALHLCSMVGSPWPSSQIGTACSSIMQRNSLHSIISCSTACL
jgi:hypothetical protein